MHDLDRLIADHKYVWRRTELWPAIASVCAASLLLGALVGAFIVSIWREL